jgi:uncharacterized protein (DUF1697 family)
MKMPLILLIRALNVSGKNVLKMEVLRQFMVEIGVEEVKTYIQSGNIVCKVDFQAASVISQKVEHILQSKAAISVKVFALQQSELQAVVNDNPFKDSDLYPSNKVYICFLSEIPNSELVLNLRNLLLESKEILEFQGNIAYLFCNDGYGKTKFSNNFIESKLKVQATTRNMNTVNALLKMSKIVE